MSSKLRIALTTPRQETIELFHRPDEAVADLQATFSERNTPALRPLIGQDLGGLWRITVVDEDEEILTLNASFRIGAFQSRLHIPRRMDLRRELERGWGYCRGGGSPTATEEFGGQTTLSLNGETGRIEGRDGRPAFRLECDTLRDRQNAAVRAASVSCQPHQTLVFYACSYTGRA